MKNPHHILAVEDEPVTRVLLKGYFEKAGYQVTTADNGEEMHAVLARERIDLVLLDINLPGVDGLTLTRELRARSEMGIILVTSRGEAVDRIVGLEMGADDYVTKPFNERELLARVKNLLRRTTRLMEMERGRRGQYRFGPWTLDLDQRRLLGAVHGEVRLTHGEFTLLDTLLRHRGQAMNRDQLLAAVSSREWMPNDRTIDVMINRLRRKLEADPSQPRILVTVHGVGYQFAARVEST
ncbi:MAG: response regulator [Magnetococcus sp. WYHC-3]